MKNLTPTIATMLICIGTLLGTGIMVILDKPTKCMRLHMTPDVVFGIGDIDPIKIFEESKYAYVLRSPYTNSWAVCLHENALISYADTIIEATKKAIRKRDLYLQLDSISEE